MGMTRFYFCGGICCNDASGIICVIDGNGRGRIDQSHGELGKLLDEGELREVVVLVLANKQGFPKSLTILRVGDQFGFGATEQRQWFIQCCFATIGDGIYGGFG